MDIHIVIDTDGNAKVLKNLPTEKALNEAIYTIAVNPAGQQPTILGVTHQPVDVKASDLKAAGVDPNAPSVPSVAQAEPTPAPKEGSAT